MSRSIRTTASSLHQLLAVAALLLGGCYECEEGPPRCDGTRVLWCSWRGDGPFSSRVLESRDCPVACADTGQGGECVDSPVPVPACAGRNGPTCVDGAVASCRGGFPVGTKPCDGGTYCTQDDACQARALCTIGTLPDPRCPDGDAAFCDDAGTNVQCQCGYEVARYACGDASRCRDVDGASICTLAGAPDPRCGDAPPGWSGFCQDNTGITCWQGVPVSSIGCGPGTCAVAADGHAQCQLTATVQPND